MLFFPEKKQEILSGKQLSEKLENIHPDQLI